MAFRADLARFQGRFGIGATRYDEEQEKALALLLRLGGHFRPQCGRLREFWVYQKWGQKQAAGITFVVTIPELLLP